MTLWFLLTAISVGFVSIDIRTTPAARVLKWGFVLLTLYSGPVGAFLYVLGCREPLARSHERYIAAPWRQVLGSTMHCVAGDGVGILVGAVVASYLTLEGTREIVLEYLLGFGFGWSIFQALFMRDMAGGSYPRALASTFLPEFVSMNLVMAGMMPIAALGRLVVGGGVSPATPEFWFVMSMALLAGFVLAYPINWWLVARGLKHGMLTVRRPVDRPRDGEMQEPVPTIAHGGHASVSPNEIAGMVILSMVIFALAFAARGEIASFQAGHTHSSPMASVGHVDPVTPSVT